MQSPSDIIPEESFLSAGTFRRTLDCSRESPVAIEVVESRERIGTVGSVPDPISLSGACTSQTGLILGRVLDLMPTASSSI